MNNEILNELKRYRGELVAHQNKILDMIEETRRSENINDRATQSFLGDLLSRASSTNLDILGVDRDIRKLMRDKL